MLLSHTFSGSAGVLTRQVVSPICFEDARDRAWLPCTSQVSLSAGLLGMECEAKLIRLVFFNVRGVTLALVASANTGGLVRHGAPPHVRRACY